SDPYARSVWLHGLAPQRCQQQREHFGVEHVLGYCVHYPGQHESTPLSQGMYYTGNGSNTIQVLQSTFGGNWQGSLQVDLQGGTNNVDVLSTRIPVSINDSGGGSDAIWVGSNGANSGGTLGGIQGQVNVSNSRGSTSLIVDDSGDSASR